MLTPEQLVSLSNLASEAMLEVNPRLTRQFSVLATFLVQHKDVATETSHNLLSSCRDSDTLVSMARQYANARMPKRPSVPQTKADSLVKIILSTYFEKSEEEARIAETDHRLAMAAENVIGHYLELYLATHIEKHGWVWCAGSSVRKVDFICQPKAKNQPWTLLQVKNRNNSENSSSRSVRLGTPIEMWYRTHSTKTETNWLNFPEELARGDLSEESFHQFVTEHLNAIKQPGDT